MSGERSRSCVSESGFMVAIMEAQWFHWNTPTRSLRHPTHLSVWAAPNGQAKAVFVQTRALVGQRWKRCRSPHAPAVTRPFIIASSRTSAHPSFLSVTTKQVYFTCLKKCVFVFKKTTTRASSFPNTERFSDVYMFCYTFVLSQSPAASFIVGAGGINLHLFSRLPRCFHILCHFCFSSLPRFIQLVINGSVHVESVVNNALVFALAWLYAQSHACVSYFLGYISIPQYTKMFACFLS